MWVFAELAYMLGEERFLDYAKLGVDFLLQHALWKMAAPPVC